ncbi:GDP-mannose 4,6-dehydratase [Acidithiobacillus caldus]|uniref:GDP-mannose 4,6-dehydratase n=1 Tax=Acidithiobacillus caldus TaxID=33059 RepID=UPI001C073878|nr:GDP-mannose 4,6-dehydratase [Acidithiobacillus caldus]MBU2763743.1 NAD-dependent epimerase/dehydratase family protein [Acidithiobacillus caldus]MBU2770393.1 NAD-dependent epimerase/dehydratase family protein [Acidithiobacillus caldus]MBU2782800.1 NAD-dependent epimerase/dehydratase family protein [Acidithiobacillus caldus]MCE5360092.1 GDP-mannose 4,6-dehydratase [Acidithiobacillus sp.]
MKLLLTGANGFVGRYVQAALPCVPLPDGLDLRDRQALSVFVAELRPNAVIHLAAQSFVPAAFENPRETFDINFTSTLNLLEALHAAEFRGRMLFVGSGDTYGQVPETDLPVREDHPLRPRNPYAVSKVAAEALCYQWSQTSGFEIVMVRPFNHIGPGQSPRFVLADFARQVMEIHLGRRVPVLQVGDIDVTRDFTDVRDVVRAYGLLLERGRNGEVYNVCSGREYRIRDLLQQLLALAGVDARIEQDPARLRRAEQRRMVASFAALERDTGWQPAIPMEQSLQDLLNDWEKKLG